MSNACEDCGRVDTDLFAAWGCDCPVFFICPHCGDYVKDTCQPCWDNPPMHAECRLGVGTDTDRVLSERRRGSWRIAIHNAAQSARRARYLRSQGTKEDKKLPLSLAAQSSSRVNYELDRGMQPSDTDDTALAILFAFVVVFVTSLIIYMATS